MSVSPVREVDFYKDGLAHLPITCIIPKNLSKFWVRFWAGEMYPYTPKILRNFGLNILAGRWARPILAVNSLHEWLIFVVN